MKYLSYKDTSESNKQLLIELIDPDDKISARTTNRPVLNLYDNEEEMYQILQTAVKTIYGNKPGIVPDVYEEFDINNTSIGNYLNASTNYLRVPTGLMFMGTVPSDQANIGTSTGEPYSEASDAVSSGNYQDDKFHSYTVLNKPNTNLIERQLANTINLDLSDLGNDIKIYDSVITKAVVDASGNSIGTDRFIGYNMEVDRETPYSLNKIYLPNIEKNTCFNVYSKFDATAANEETITVKYKTSDTAESSLKEATITIAAGTSKEAALNNFLVFINTNFSEYFTCEKLNVMVPFYIYDSDKKTKFQSSDPKTLGLYELNNGTMTLATEDYFTDTTYYEKNANDTYTVYAVEKSSLNNIGSELTDLKQASTQEAVVLTVLDEAVQSGYVLYITRSDSTVEGNNDVFGYEKIKKTEQKYYTNQFDLSAAFLTEFKSLITNSTTIGTSLGLEPTIEMTGFSSQDTLHLCYNKNFNSETITGITGSFSLDSSKRFLVCNDEAYNNIESKYDIYEIGTFKADGKTITDKKNSIDKYDRRTIYTKMAKLNDLKVDTRADFINYFLYKNISDESKADTLIKAANDGNIILRSPVVNIQGFSDGKNSIKIDNNSKTVSIASETSINESSSLINRTAPNIADNASEKYSLTNGENGIEITSSGLTANLASAGITSKNNITASSTAGDITLETVASGKSVNVTIKDDGKSSVNINGIEKISSSNNNLAVLNGTGTETNIELRNKEETGTFVLSYKNTETEKKFLVLAGGSEVFGFNSTSSDIGTYRGISPYTDNAYSLGSSDKKWKYAYLRNIDITSSGTADGILFQKGASSTFDVNTFKVNDYAGTNNFLTIDTAGDSFALSSKILNLTGKSALNLITGTGGNINVKIDGDTDSIISINNDTDNGNSIVSNFYNCKLTAKNNTNVSSDTLDLTVNGQATTQFGMLSQTVVGDYTDTIGGKSTITIKGNSDKTVSGNSTETITGSLTSSSASSTISNAGTRTVNAQNYDLNLNNITNDYLYDINLKYGQQQAQFTALGIGFDSTSINNTLMLDSGSLNSDKTYVSSGAILKLTTHTSSSSYSESNPTVPYLYVRTSADGDAGIMASKVYNAVWNDIADAVSVPDEIIVEYGRAYVLKNGKYALASSKHDKGYFGIASDTYGYLLGIKKDKNYIPVAVGGFVLAYTDKVYPSGTELIICKNGILTKANMLDKLFRRSNIAGIFFKEEKEKLYNGISVNGRNWIKVY